MTTYTVETRYDADGPFWSVVNGDQTVASLYAPCTEAHARDLADALNEYQAHREAVKEARTAIAQAASALTDEQALKLAEGLQQGYKLWGVKGHDPWTFFQQLFGGGAEVQAEAERAMAESEQMARESDAGIDRLARKGKT